MSEHKDEDLLTLAGTLLNLLARRGWCLGTAESLTGGMVAESITAVSGASASYLGGVVGYSDREKTVLLGVSAPLLKECGAVSAEVVKAMARVAPRGLKFRWGSRRPVLPDLRWMTEARLSGRCSWRVRRHEGAQWSACFLLEIGARSASNRHGPLFGWQSGSWRPTSL